MVRGEVGGGRNRVRAPPVDTTDLDSPFDQITRLEDGRFRDSNPIAPKQSISSFRISISPLSVAWIKTEKLSSKTRINHPRIYPIVISRPFLKIQKSQDIFQIIEIKIIDPSFDLHVLPRKKTVHDLCQSFQILSPPWKKARIQGRGSMEHERVFWRPPPRR